jgi:hypothetical protein
MAIEIKLARRTTRTDSADSRAGLQKAWVTERTAALAARHAGHPRVEWQHLERAHIVSQPLVGLHVRTHVAMLSAALRRKDLREVLGQTLRLVLAGPGSLTGRFPVGNTGGADVSAFTPMAVPDDLREVLASYAGRRSAR